MEKHTLAIPISAEQARTIVGKSVEIDGEKPGKIIEVVVNEEGIFAILELSDEYVKKIEAINNAK